MHGALDAADDGIADVEVVGGDEPDAEDTGDGASHRAGGRREATLVEEETTRPETEVEA